MDFDAPGIEVRRLQATGLAVTIEEMLLDLRADSADENATVERMIRGCTDYFEKRCGYRLAPASYAAQMPCLPPCLEIPRGPIREVDGIQYWDHATMSWLPIDAALYQVEEVNEGRGFRVGFDHSAIYNLHIPAPTIPRAFPYRMTFSAGFDRADETGSEVNGLAEDGMILALKGLVALEFQNREAGNNIDGEKDIVLRAYRWFW